MPLRTAILGCGRMSRHHARALVNHPDAELVALCDVSESLLARYIAEHLTDVPAPETFTDAQRMYASARLDAVVIATPHTLHFSHAVTALEAGCHVFLEKPMVTSSDHAGRLANMVDEAGKILVVGFNTPCTPAFRFLRRVITAGETGANDVLNLGPLEVVNGFLSQNWMKKTAGTWRQDSALSGGGQAYDSGAHLLNSIVWSVQAAPAEVFAYVDNHGAPVDVNSVLNVRFANGVLASIAISGNCQGSGSFLTFMFERGRIDIDGWEGRWIKVFGADGEIPDPGVEGIGVSPIINFLDSILGHDKPVTGPQDGVNHSLLMDALYESARQGKPAAAGKS